VVHLRIFAKSSSAVALRRTRHSRLAMRFLFDCSGNHLLRKVV
jgi:hypothetical protein